MRQEDRGERAGGWAVLPCVFANRNEDPELLMEAATWWIQIHRLDHFEKASRVKALVLAEGL
ncbi:DUF6500 family protein [Stenotrophomonas humi]